MTLPDGDRVEAELLRPHGGLERLLQPVSGRDLASGDRVGAVRDDVEQLELHAGTPWALSAVSARTRASGFFSPASMPRGRWLPAGGRGQVAKSV